MYKSKDKQREATRGRVRRYRNKGVTSSTGEGVTEEGVTLGGFVAHPDILDKLTNPVWRDRLTKLQAAFNNSHHPDYSSDCWLGQCNLAFAFDLLDCTA